jgi:signal recognition particle subunit SEC65
MPFPNTTTEVILDKIRKSFLEVQNCRYPKLLNTWFCQRVCHYNKNRFDGSKQSICQDVNDEIKRNGIEKVMAKRCNFKFEYKAPGI